jgi:hypothetical protein
VLSARSWKEATPFMTRRSYTIRPGPVVSRRSLSAHRNLSRLPDGRGLTGTSPLRSPIGWVDLNRSSHSLLRNTRAHDGLTWKPMLKRHWFELGRRKPR